MFGADSERMRGIILTALIFGFSLPTVAFPQSAFREAMRPPPVSFGESVGSVDGSYPTVLLPLEVSRVTGDLNDVALLPFGTQDLSYNMSCRQDTLGGGDIICKGAYLSQGVRVYRKTLNRGYVHSPGLRSTLRIEADSTFTEIEAGSGIEFHYDANGRLEKIQDPNGRVVTITRNTVGKVTQVSDDAERSITFTYNGNLISQANFSAGGNITYQYASTSVGQKISQVTNLVGDISTWTYGPEGQLISWSDPLSGTFSYEIDQANLTVIRKDSDGAIISTTRIDTTANFSVSALNTLGLASGSSQDYRGLTTIETTSRGQVTTTDYDADRNAIIIQMNYDTVVIKHANFGLPTLVSHSLGETTLYKYDANSRLAEIKYPAGDTEAFSYDTAGNILTHRLPNGGELIYSYDAYGNREREQDPDGVVTNFGYNLIGFVTLRRGGGGGPTSYFDYNGFGYLTSSGNGFDTAVATVDSAGRQLAVTLPGGGRILTDWTASGPVTISNSVTGETVTYEYQSGRLVSMTDATGAKTKFSHNPSGRLMSYKSPLGDVTSYGYDSAANLASVAFPTNPLGSPLRQYASDSQNRLVKYVRETGDVIEYTLDAVGRLVERKANSSMVAAMTYDSRGFLAQATDPLGTMIYTRNAIGQATSMVHPSGISLTYDYSDAGRLTKVLTTGYSSEITYDSHDRLSSVGTEAGGIVFDYDFAGRASAMTYPNGVVAVYSYGATGAANRVEYRNVGGETIVFDINRDSMSKIAFVSRSDLNETMEVGYSPRGEIIRADIRRTSDTISYSYTYDSAGNRTRFVANSDTTNYSYDPGNLLDTGGADYSYNLAGEVTAIGSRTVSYNAQGMLRSDTTPQGMITYDYDAFNRRQRSVVGGTATWRVWDEAQNEISDVDGSGNIMEFRYFIPGKIDGLLGFSRGSQTYFTLNDPAGNVAMVVDESGTVVARYTYGPSQLRMNDSFDSIGNRFRFAKRREEASGEIFVRARSLEAVTGRFMQRDPLFVGNGRDPFSWQNFAYANNDSLNKTDATGFACIAQPPDVTITKVGQQFTLLSIEYLPGGGNLTVRHSKFFVYYIETTMTYTEYLNDNNHPNTGPCSPKLEVNDEMKSGEVEYWDPIWSTNWPYPGDAVA